MSKSYEPADQLARGHTPRAIEVLAEIMETGEKDSDRVKAAALILDRGHGTPGPATIQLPMSRKQAAALAAMSDEELLQIIRAPLPDLAAITFDGEVLEATVAPAGDPLLL